MPDDLLHAITIPLFTGGIGWLTNWSGVLMLFYPVTYKGVRLPGLSTFAAILPRKIQQIPGIMQGGLGWQGIIPSRAAKMGSIAVDKGISKVGSVSEFYKELEPGKIAEHILASSQGDMRDLVERIMQREHPDLWNDLPPGVREAVHERVQQQLPDIVHEVTDELGEYVDQLLDLKLMVIRYIEADPKLINRIFLEVGRKELKLMVNLGFWIGLTLGIPLVFVIELVPLWWVLPVGGVIIGYVTNWIGLWVIFEPIEPRFIGRFKVHGLFLRRQPEVAEVYSDIIANDIVTLSHMGEELLQGPRSDRTRQMIETALRPAVDRAVGPARGAVRVAMGAREYDAIRDSVAVEAVSYTMTPLSDPGFNATQSGAIQRLIAERIAELPSADFSEMLRSAIKEDEWLLLLHGAVLGFGAGLVHLAIFGV